MTKLNVSVTRIRLQSSSFGIAADEAEPGKTDASKDQAAVASGRNGGTKDGGTRIEALASKQRSAIDGNVVKVRRPNRPT